jgi:hypothetical protein
MLESKDLGGKCADLNTLYVGLARAMVYNFAYDVMLPGSSGPPLGFMMYPAAETAGDRIDSLDSDGFKHEITAREIAPANG